MSYIKNKSNPIFNAIKLLGITSVATVMAFGSVISAQADLDANGQGYTDSLNNPHQEAVYNYNYENILPTAPGYFELVLPKLTGANPIDLFDVTSITETYPLETSTYTAVAGTQTKSTNPTTAVYAASNGSLGIRISPQMTCVASATGCTPSDVPGSVPSRLTIKIALKTSAPTTVSVSSGAGSVKFPQGIDIASLQWRINSAYVKTNDVLDPSVTPNAAIQGQGGTGTPAVGQPYTVVTSGIKAVNAAPLNAPNGTCKTTIGGTNYTGTGITNGVCTINIPVNATATAIPSGTVNLNDGGTPRAIVLNNIPYSSVTPGVTSSPLTTADIPGLTVNCAAAVVNTTTTCTFTLPTNKTLPSDFKLGGGDSTPAGTCVASGSTVTCTNVPTGTQTGSQPIYGQIGSEAKTDTGEKIQVNPAAVQTVIKTGGTTIPLTTPITQDDLNKLGFNCGTLNSVSVSSTTTCTGTLPTNKTLDTANPLKLAIGDAGTLSSECTVSGTVITCNNVPTGSQTGSQPLKAKLGNGALTNTGTNVDVKGVEVPAVVNTNKVISDADIPNIGTGNANDPFLSLVCGASNLVKVGIPTTCFGTLKDGWSIPNDFKFGVGTNPGGTCSQSGQNIVCTNVPVTTTSGSSVPVKAQIGSGSTIDTGKKVAVQADSVALARTGGAALIGLGIATLAALAGFVIYTRKSKINKKSTKLN